MAEYLVVSGSRKISALTSVSGISGSTSMPVVMGGGTVQISHTNFLSSTLLTQANTFSGNNTFGGQTTLQNGIVNGSLVVNGGITANQYIISSSVSHITTSFSSGSTKFGDSSDDTHQFTGSVSITGSFLVNGIAVDGSLLNSFTQSVNTFSASVAAEVNNLQDVTASYALTSSLNAYTASNDGRVNSLISVTGSYATTASLNAYTASNNSVINSLISVTGSYATTGSNNFIGNQTITGSLNTKDGGFSVSSGSGFLTSSVRFIHNTISPTQGSSVFEVRHINNDFVENFAVKLFADDYIAKMQYEKDNVTYDILQTNLAGDLFLMRDTRLFGTNLIIDGTLEAKQNARVTGSLVVSGSGVLIGTQTITGSLIVSGSSTFTNIGLAKFTGSVNVTGSVNADSFTLDATSTTNIVALNSEFNFDLSSSQTPQIYKTLLLSDGKILVAGRFQSIDGHVTDDIARLNANGSVDTSFTATNIGGGISPAQQLINTFVTQSDDSIIIVGSFSSVQGNSRTGVARLSANGALDSGFSNPGLTTFGSVRDVVIQSDDKIVIVGQFDGGIKRLNTDGTIDTSLSVPDTTGFTDNAFYSVAIQNSGSAEHILVGGDFTQWNTSANYDKLVKLSISGALDTGFAGANLNISNRSGDVIRKIKLDSNNDIFIAGLFTGSTQHANIARISSEDNGLDGRGSFDSSFATYTNGTVRDFEFYDNDKILIGGNFEASGVTAAFQYSAFRFVIVNESDGQAASGFNAANYLITNNSVFSITPVGTNVLLGGTFTTVNSNSRENIASLKLSGIGSVTTSKDYLITADTQKLLVSSSNTFFSGDVNISGSVSTTSITGSLSFNNLTNRPALVSSSQQIKNYGDFATTGSNTFFDNQTIVGNVTFPSSSFISTTNASGGLSLSALDGGTLFLNADGGEGDVLVGRNNWSGSLTVIGNTNLTGSLGIREGNINLSGSIYLDTAIWNYVTQTYTSIPVTYGATELTFTVLPDNTITDMIVAVGAGGYTSGSINLTIPGTTFPGGTTPANDIVFNIQTFESAGPVYSTDPTSSISYVSGTPPQRYDNISSTGTFGIGADDKHWTFDTSGSFNTPGDINVSGSVIANSFTGSFTGSFVGDGSGLTGLPVAASINTGSFATTASFNTFTSSYTTGSFTGSFVGDGSGLTGIPGATPIETGSFATTGSNTFIGNQIVTGSVTISGSISQVGVGVESIAISNTPITTLTSATGLTAIGFGAGESITTGYDNTFIGNQAGRDNETGYVNTFVGAYAGALNTSGIFNTFIGRAAGQFNTTGQRNTFVGTTAGQVNTGTGNTFLGTGAGIANTTAGSNTFVGNNAGATNSTAQSNTFIGENSGFDNTSGSYNTFIGSSAGANNTTANDNTFVGSFAGFTNTIGAQNTFMGYNAGSNNSVGLNNTFIGWQAGAQNVSGSGNTFLGRDAGVNSRNASNNTFIGYNAGYNSGNGPSNTFVGYNAGQGNISGSGNTFVGALAGQNTRGNNNAFVGSSAGRDNAVGINNAFFGPFAGQSNISGSYNTFIGASAGATNTQADNNTFVGMNAGSFNSVGTDNTFVGMNAGTNNNSGSGNSFFGRQAAVSNTTGANNSTFGFQAGQSNQSGSNNSFFGKDAGSFLGNGSSQNNSADNSVFLGAQTRANASAETNQIVIGYQAVGNGSNTVTIGNSSITDTYLEGTINISTAILSQVSQSLEFANDTAAAAGGVPLGGLYRSGNFILIRLV